MPRPDRDRVPFSMWLSRDVLAYVKTLAESECEGNISQMIRRLLSEALEARGSASPRY